MGPKLINSCMPEPMGTKEFGKNGEKNPNTRGREGPSQRGKELENRWRKKKDYEEGEGKWRVA